MLAKSSLDFPIGFKAVARSGACGTPSNLRIPAMPNFGPITLWEVFGETKRGTSKHQEVVRISVFTWKHGIILHEMTAQRHIFH